MLKKTSNLSRALDLLRLYWKLTKKTMKCVKIEKLSEYGVFLVCIFPQVKDFSGTQSNIHLGNLLESLIFVSPTTEGSHPKSLIIFAITGKYLSCSFKDCVRYIFASLSFKSKREQLWNLGKWFSCHFKTPFRFQENQILIF